MFASLSHLKIIPVLKRKELDPDDALHIAEALINAGLPIMEIIFRRHSDSKAIKAIAKEFPDFFIGAGGILNRDQVIRAADYGARFATAPGMSEEIIKAANKSKIMFAPGANTPGTIENILLGGCVDFQFFPAEASGGVEYLKAIIEPFEHLPLDVLPRGGITFDKIAGYLEIPHVVAVCLENIVLDEYIDAKSWQAIGKKAREAWDIANTVSKNV